MPVKFALDRADRPCASAASIKANPLIGSYLVSDAFFLAHFQNPLPVAVLVKTDGSAGVAAGRARTRWPPTRT